MLLIINHKANLTYKEIINYEKNIRKLDLIIIPSLCYLPIFKKGKYKLGSQDISEFKATNRTGEINGAQLKSLNVKYCLIGHSDRREYNKEESKCILEKFKRCNENNIIPLYCIGETSNNYKDELEKQIDLIFSNSNFNELLIIYEPKYNIGNINANLINVETITNEIKSYIKNKYNKSSKIIYGGGVNINNIKYLKNIEELDGLIISSESLNFEELKKIYKEAKK